MTKAQVLKKLNKESGAYKVTFIKETNGKTRVMKFTTEDMDDAHVPGGLAVQELTKSGSQWRSFKFKNVLELEPLHAKKAVATKTTKAIKAPIVAKRTAIAKATPSKAKNKAKAKNRK